MVQYQADLDRLNHKTGDLRDSINRNCGPKGRAWYQALMTRTCACPVVRSPSGTGSPRARGRGASPPAERPPVSLEAVVSLVGRAGANHDGPFKTANYRREDEVSA